MPVYVNNSLPKLHLPFIGREVINYPNANYTEEQSDCVLTILITDSNFLIYCINICQINKYVSVLPRTELLQLKVIKTCVGITKMTRNLGPSI